MKKIPQIIKIMNMIILKKKYRKYWFRRNFIIYSSDEKENELIRINIFQLIKNKSGLFLMKNA